MVLCPTGGKNLWEPTKMGSQGYPSGGGSPSGPDETAGFLQLILGLMSLAYIFKRLKSTAIYSALLGASSLEPFVRSILNHEWLLKHNASSASCHWSWFIHNHSTFSFCLFWHLIYQTYPNSQAEGWILPESEPFVCWWFVCSPFQVQLCMFLCSCHI